MSDKKFTLEHVDKILSDERIENLPREEVDGELNRKREFKVLGLDAVYTIEWYCNICYLDTNANMRVPFEFVSINSNWPNNAKANLSFERYGETCCVLPIEY